MFYNEHKQLYLNLTYQLAFTKVSHLQIPTVFILKHYQICCLRPFVAFTRRVPFTCSPI